MFSRISGLVRSKKGEPLPADASPRSESARLLNDPEANEIRIDKYLDTEAQDTIDTSNPEMPQAARTFIKELTFFSNAGYLVELAACILILLLGFKYFFSGCFLVGGCMLGVGFTTSWLSIPQLVLPFISNPIVRWFIVTNHSHHITGLLSILGAFIVLSYFSWTNTCRSESTWIQATTTTVLVLLSFGVVLFLIACVRDEKGNGGYIKWVLRLVF